MFETWRGFAGTLPGWVTAISSTGVFVLVLIGVLRFLPDLMRALSDRLRARADGDATAAESWRDIEARVSEELAECRREREADAQLRVIDAEQRRRIDDENFKLRIVVSMMFDEIDRLDPGSDIVLKARAIMAVATSAAGPPDREQARQDVLLAQLDKTPAKRRPRRREPGAKT